MKIFNNKKKREGKRKKQIIFCICNLKQIKVKCIILLAKMKNLNLIKITQNKSKKIKR